MSVVSNNYEKEEMDLSNDMEFTRMKDEEKVPPWPPSTFAVRPPALTWADGGWAVGRVQMGLANGLAKNTTIKVLKLNKVMLKDSFCEALGKSLETNKTLEIVSMESNAITGVGITALANGLKANTTLKELKLLGQEKSASTESEHVRAAPFFRLIEAHALTRVCAYVCVCRLS
jgi:hypothetical protein